MVFFLLISFIVSAQSISTCNSFPKIVGGSLEGTYLIQLDIYNDYLALVGDIIDTSLTRISVSTWTRFPYVVLTSISTGGKYYWAKVLSLKTMDSMH